MILTGAVFYFVVLILLRDEMVITTLEKVNETIRLILKRG